MHSGTDEVPAKRIRIGGHEKTQIPHETMLEVLLWLDRFDLDGKQITTKSLRSLAENKQMPLRKVDRVEYEVEERRYSDPPDKKSTLSIFLEEEEKGDPAIVELQIETDAEAQTAASYLSSCFVRYFSVHRHRIALPKNAVIAAPALIGELWFQSCNFERDEEDALGGTLGGSTFRCLTLGYSSIPAWQINDNLLECLRLCGCNEVNVCSDVTEPYNLDEKFEVTEEGILNYCFALDDAMPMPESRTLRFTWTTITPAFFKKLVEASKASQLTCDVKLYLEHLWFDVGTLDVGVRPSRSQEYDRDAAAHVRNVRYNIADHGNGIRLLVHFRSEDGEEWEVVVRHGKKDHEEFFDPPPVEEESEEEYWECDPELAEDRDFFDNDWN